MADANSPWWAVVVAAGAPVAAGMFAYVKWVFERRDKQGETFLTRDERREREIEAQRATLTAFQTAIFDRQQAENLGLRQRVADLERVRDALESDRDRGWQLARWWHDRAHELRHAGTNAQQMVIGLMVAHLPDMKRPEWPDMHLPPFESPFPKTDDVR